VSENSDEGIELVYRNHRGEVRTRRIRPLGIYFGSTQWHPEPQWLVNAVDLEDDAVKQFALKDFLGAPHLPPAPSAEALAGAVELADKMFKRQVEEGLRADRAEENFRGLRYVVYDEERIALAAFRDEEPARVFWRPIKNSRFKTLKEVDRD